VLLKPTRAPGRRRPRNIERADRILRTVLGAALLAAVVLVPSGWRWLGLLGLLPLATGLAGWCPLYAWLARD
jgi:hypothetical protein